MLPSVKGEVLGGFNSYDHLVLLVDGINKSFCTRSFVLFEPYQVHKLSESIQVIKLVYWVTVTSTS